MSGIFSIIFPTSVGTKTLQETYRESDYNMSDPALINGLLGAQPLEMLGFGAEVNPNAAVNGVIRFNFDQSSPIISIDGATPISFNSLPAGFTPTSAVLSILSEASGAQLFMQLDPLTEGPQINLSPLFFNGYNFAYATVPSMLDIINNGFGFRIVFSTNNEFGYLSNYSFTGTYDIIQTQSQFTLENSKIPVRVGDKARISSSTGILGGAIQIRFNYFDSIKGSQLITLDIDNQNPSTTINGNRIFGLNFIISQQPNLLQFYLPWGFGTFSGLVTITIVGNGIQFSGSVVLGTLQILFEDGAGIYTLVEDQTNDKLYFRAGYITDNIQIMLPDMREDEINEDSFFSLLSYSQKILSNNNYQDEQEDFSAISILRIPIVTRNVEIPSPFIKTAFLP